MHRATKKGLFLLTMVLWASLLSACGYSGAGQTPQPPATETDGGASLSADYTPADTACYDSGFIHMRADLPAGWSYTLLTPGSETSLPQDVVGFTLRDTARPALVLTLGCWPQSFGMCGTGVTFEDVTLPGGQPLTLATEQGSDAVWLTAIFNDTPGSYVITATLPPQTWTDCREDILAVLDHIAVGEGCLAKAEALAIAEAWYNYPAPYASLDGRYDVTTGQWKISFLDKQYTAVASVWVDNEGTVVNFTR